MGLSGLITALFFSLTSFAALPHAGTYTLVTGTDGCAESVEWVNECQGFILRPTHKGVALSAEKFCRVNKGKSFERLTENQKLVTLVTHKEEQIQKKETQVFFTKNESLELESEDSIIIDAQGSFLWDHNKHSRGMSCLYQK